MLCAVSNASPDLMRIPFSAPFPVPTMMATGVARPSAQGQEMTSTEIPMETANSGVCPARSQPMEAARAMPMTTGTNTPEILSASFAMGALLELASSTRRMIWASVVSAPTLVARNLKNPALLMVAAITVLPGSFSTGMLSPVMAASSMLVLPSRITPSTGTLWPGRTSTVSPTTTSSTGITVSIPPRSTAAVLGARSISLVIASLVLPLLLVSRYLPSVMSARIIAADSK